jgi:hypothetical protein
MKPTPQQIRSELGEISAKIEDVKAHFPTMKLHYLKSEHFNIGKPWGGNWHPAIKPFAGIEKKGKR